VVFLGMVDASRVADLLAAAAQVSVAPFVLEINRSGWWAKSQVVWLAPRHVPDGLWKLWGDLRKLVSACGLPVETRPYQPHVTLARNVAADMAVGYTPIRWNVRDFCLVESSTGEEGAE
jgi:2'-5' RNA ligase